MTSSRGQHDSATNEHGVLVDTEGVVFARGDGYRFAARVAQHGGLWFYGLSAQWGGCTTGAGGVGRYPSIHGTSYATRGDAVECARRDAAARIESAFSFCTEGPGSKPYRHLQAARREIESARQGVLFP